MRGGESKQLLNRSHADLDREIEGVFGNGNDAENNHESLGSVRMYEGVYGAGEDRENEDAAALRHPREAVNTADVRHKYSSKSYGDPGAKVTASGDVTEASDEY